jgi:hypothetical protein
MVTEALREKGWGGAIIFGGSGLAGIGVVKLFFWRGIFGVGRAAQRAVVPKAEP